MSPKINYLLFFSFLLLSGLTALAQTDTTPYSSQGLGKLSSSGFVYNIGMGGIGIAAGSGLRINNINPALLYRNNLTSFDMAISAEYKDLIKGEETAHSFTGGLAYGAFAFPAIENRWTISVGLMPYSTVDYTIEESRSVIGNGQPAQLSLEGDGGVSQVYLSNGIRIYKNLAAGIKIGYLFGTIDRSLSVLPLTTDFSYRTSYKESLFYSGLLPEGGLYYGFKVGKTTYLSAGMIYQPETKLRVLRDVKFESTSISNPDEPIAQDTIANEPGRVMVPQKLGFGLAMEKYLKYTVGVDITLQQWENFGSYRPDSLQVVSNGNDDGLQNSLKVALGGEYIPDISSVSSYFKRVAYRIGFNYQHTPFSVNNEQIKDMGISFGMALPLSNLSSLNLAFETGRRGTTSNDLIQENYFKVLLGISFNDRWFVRRRYD